MGRLGSFLFFVPLAAFLVFCFWMIGLVIYDVVTGHFGMSPWASYTVMVLHISFFAGFLMRMGSMGIGPGQRKPSNKVTEGN